MPRNSNQNHYGKGNLKSMVLFATIFLILQQWLEHEQFSEVFKHCYHDNVFSFFLSRGMHFSDLPRANTDT